MKAKEYLMQAYEICVKIKEKKNRIEQIEALLLNISPVISDIQRNGNTHSQLMEERVCSLETLKESVKHDELVLAEKKLLVANLIMQITSNSWRKILYKRYIEFKKWEDIAMEMNYSKRYVLYLHNRAIMSMEELIARKNLSI